MSDLNDTYEQSLLARYSDKKDEYALSLIEFKQLTDYLLKRVNQFENGNVRANQVYRAFRKYMSEDLKIDKSTLRDWIKSVISVDKLLAEADVKQKLDILLNNRLTAIVGTSNDLEKYIEEKVKGVIYDAAYEVARTKLKQATIEVCISEATKEA